MNKYLIPFLLGLFTGTPMVSVNAQSVSEKKPTEETKNTVITFRGDTLIRKVSSTVVTDPAVAEKAWQEYNSAMIQWSDTVQKIAKNHQSNPNLGAPVFPPMPKEPSKASGNNINNANTIKKQLILDGNNDTLYFEYKEYDATGKLVKEDVRILDDALQQKEVKQIIKSTETQEIIEDENQSIIEKNTPPKTSTNGNSTSNQRIETNTKLRIEIPENTELRPGTYYIQRKRKPATVIHSLRFYYGLNNAYQIGPDASALKVLNNVKLLPQQSDAMPQLKRVGSDNMGLETSWGYKLIGDKFRLFMGLRYDNYDFRFQDPTTIILPNEPTFTNATLNPNFSPNPEQIESQLCTHYVGVPIALGFHSELGESDLTIRAGFTANYLVQSSFRTRFKDKSKNRVVDDFNLNDFMLMPTLQMEYGDLGVFMTYSANSIFRKNEAFPMRLLTLGLSLNLG